MRKLLLLSLVASSLGLAASSFAQAAGPVGVPPASAPEGGRQGRGGQAAAAKMNAEILAKLNLSDDQKAKLKAHEDEIKTKLADLKAQGKGAKGDKAKQDALKEQAKDLRKGNQKFMKELLTKDQMKEYMKLRRDAMKAQKDKAGTTPATPTKP